MGRGSWGRGSEPLPQKLMGLGECSKLPQWGSGWSPDRKYILDLLRAIENTSSGRKCRTQFNLFTEQRRSRGNPFEKHGLNTYVLVVISQCMKFGNANTKLF